MENIPIQAIETPQINLLIPLYNEEEVYMELIKRLNSVMDNTSLSVQVIMVDDGSQDNTSLLMKETAMTDNRYVAIFLSRNFGHQLALTAGLNYVNASEAVLILDGDLQDPPELLDEFYTYFQKGYEVVYAMRSSKKERWFKRKTSEWFYQFFNKMTETEIPLNTGDFALISRRVADILATMPEKQRFVRGMRSWIGFSQIGLHFERETRKHGETKYPLRKMVRLALDGIFSFSRIPTKVVMILGLFCVLSSIVFFIVVLVKYYMGLVIEGFTSLVFVIILFGGVQLISIGILGEYILRIFFQVKNRPLFIVKGVISNKVEKK